MSMKEIRTEEVSVATANELVGEEFSREMWELLVRRVDYRDMRFDAAKGVIRHPGFVPFKEMFQGVLEELREGAIDARPCSVCARLFDVNVDSGIFSDPDALEGFICEACARSMTAWDFYNDRLT